jgi:exodeoxyribonuclease V beta subunit
VVVDYKSNRLHRQGDPDWLENYTAEAMQSAMVSHDYPLQAFLYSVALHRYLRWRLGQSYDPSAHLAGSTYLFLRGMVGQIDSDGRALGVSVWEPPIEAILTADRILAGDR